jgi:hypothetical protein
MRLRAVGRLRVVRPLPPHGMRLVCALQRRPKTVPQADAPREPLDQHAGMARLSRRFHRRRDGSTPILLPSFFGAMLVVVAAIAVMGRTGSDLADVGAVVLLVLAAGLLMVALARILGEQPPEDEPGDPKEGS